MLVNPGNMYCFFMHDYLTPLVQIMHEMGKAKKKSLEFVDVGAGMARSSSKLAYHSDTQIRRSHPALVVATRIGKTFQRRKIPLHARMTGARWW